MHNRFQIPLDTQLGKALEMACQYFDSAELFFGHGTDNSWDEAVYIGLWVMDYGSDPGQEALSIMLTPDQVNRFVNAVNRRVSERIPAAYITGEAWFCGIRFAIDERVLVPRSPIAELIQNQYKPWVFKRPTTILDLCCGSGCIGIAAATYDENAEVVLTDLSSDAIDVARNNLTRHQLADRVNLVKGNLFESINGYSFDLILTNPPYVDIDDLESMPSEYHHEPEIGLGSGQDGLDISRRILKESAEYLTENGLLVLEVGNSWRALEKAYPEFPFTWVTFEHGGDGVCVLTRKELLHECFINS